MLVVASDGGSYWLVSVCVGSLPILPGCAPSVDTVGGELTLSLEELDPLYSLGL